MSTKAGQLHFGKRTKLGRDAISGSVEPLVSVELWDTAQATLSRNRLMPKNTPRRHLLRSVIHCVTCGLHYVGSQGRDGVGWYRCGGALQTRGPREGRCPAKGLRGPELESLVWDDIERFLRDPGEILAELDVGGERDRAASQAQAASLTLNLAIEELESQQRRAVGLAVRGLVDEASLQPELERIAAERSELERRLSSLAPETDEQQEVDGDLLEELRTRLAAGLDDAQRQEIVQLLVARISVTTDLHEDGTKQASASISYRFPGVVPTRTGTGSSLRRGGHGRDSGRGHWLARSRRFRPPAVGAARRARSVELRELVQEQNATVRQCGAM